MKRRTPVIYARQGSAKVHVVNDATGRGRCGAELWGDEYLARLVPEHERCGQARCARWWPAILRVVG